MCVRVRGEQGQGASERKKKSHRLESARTRLARVHGYRYGAKEETEKMERREKDVLAKGERRRNENENVCTCVSEVGGK